MNVIEQLAIGVLGGILTLLAQWGWERIQEKRGIFTGKWEQLIYKTNDINTLEKRDLLVCRQRGRLVQAKITRVYPENQKGREWTFYGRYARGTLFGHFWSKDEKNPSFGTIFLRQIDSECFKGFYTRYQRIVEDYEKDTITITRIPLQWHQLTD